MGTIAALFVFLLSAVLQAKGQGSRLNVLQTGGGQTLVTGQESLSLAGIDAAEVMFSFGFITGETPAPGTFLDSFTVSFQSPSLSTVAVLVTVDGSGPVWLPSTPGGLILPDSLIQRQGITPPADAPVSGRGAAYQVLVPLPPALLGPTLTVTFDLFDNQNGINSLGWYQGLQVVSVPEPQPTMLIGVGLIIVALKKCVGS